LLWLSCKKNINVPIILIFQKIWAQNLEYLPIMERCLTKA
jgi:hypothetical protein